MALTRLPESQLDRFLMRVRIGYPGEESEREILRNGHSPTAHVLEAVLTGTELIETQNDVETPSRSKESLVGLHARNRAPHARA